MAKFLYSVLPASKVFEPIPSVYPASFPSRAPKLFPIVSSTILALGNKGPDVLPSFSANNKALYITTFAKGLKCFIFLEPSFISQPLAYKFHFCP